MVLLARSSAALMPPKSSIQRAMQRGNMLIRCSSSSSSSSTSSLLQNVASKSVSAQEVVQQYLEQAEARNGSLNSYITIDRQGAMQQVIKFFFPTACFYFIFLLFRTSFLCDGLKSMSAVSYYSASVFACRRPSKK